MSDAYERLNKILGVIRRYLPPGGITQREALTESIGLVDPMPTNTDYEQLKATIKELLSALQLGIDMFKANDVNVPKTIETMQDAITNAKQVTGDKE